MEAFSDPSSLTAKKYELGAGMVLLNLCLWSQLKAYLLLDVLWDVQKVVLHCAKNAIYKLMIVN